jgi:hypothetical protein
VSRVCWNGFSNGRAFWYATMYSDELPSPITQRPGAASASAAALIASTAGPRVCTGRIATPSRSVGAHCDASASGTKPSRSCASLVHTSE